ncbi:aminotransferase, partial [Pseudomonas aeruginosa]
CGTLWRAVFLLSLPCRHWRFADPAYQCKCHFRRLVDGAAELVPVGPDSRYQLPPDLMQRHWDSARVGALVVTSSDPTGTLLD